MRHDPAVGLWLAAGAVDLIGVVVIGIIESILIFKAHHTMYTTNDTAKLLGRSAPTVRRWSNTFGAWLQPGARQNVDEDGEAVERVFTDADVRLLAWIGRQFDAKMRTDDILAALAAGQAQPVDLVDLVGDTVTTASDPASNLVTASQSDRWLAMLADAMTGTRQAMTAIADDVRSRQSADSVATDLAQLAQRLDAVVTRLDALEKRLDALEKRLDALDNDWRSRRFILRL